MPVGEIDWRRRGGIRISYVLIRMHELKSATCLQTRLKGRLQRLSVDAKLFAWAGQ